MCSIADLMLPQSCRVAMESLCGSLQKVLEDPRSRAVVFRLLCLRKHLEGPLDQIINFVLSCGISWCEEASGICLPKEFPRDADGAGQGPHKEN